MPKVYLIHLVIILVVGIHGVVKAQSSDESGNFPASDLQSLAPLHFSHQYIGEVLNSLPNPSALRGLTFREGKLWGVTAAGAGGTGVLFEMNADTAPTSRAWTCTRAQTGSRSCLPSRLPAKTPRQDSRQDRARTIRRIAAYTKVPPRDWLLDFAGPALQRLGPNAPTPHCNSTGDRP